MDRIGRHRPKWFIQKWRKRKGLTQEELADRIETTKSVISEIESGDKRLHDDHVGPIAFALGVEVSDLLYDPDMPTPTEIFRMATPDQQREILEFAKFVMSRKRA